MTTRAFTVLSFLIVVPIPPSRAADQADARMIIDQAIEAMGGREALAQYQKPVQYEYKGKALGGSGWADLTMKVTAVLPEKFATEQESLNRGKKAPFAIQFNGKEIWTNGVGPITDATRVAGYRDKLYAEWLATLLPLDDRAFQLATMDETMIGGRSALGVKVSHADRPDVRLYFDKVNFTLVKFSRQMQAGEFDETYDDFAELD
ncbi:MAG TPA: hypothetical protein VFW87_21635, partial [Pirellulales bacterium]|nr:hypothetical protein [Pirellulales bacterium]